MLKCMLSFLASDKPFYLFLISLDQPFLQHREETVQKMQEEKQKIVFLEEVVSGSGEMVRSQRELNSSE